MDNDSFRYDIEGLASDMEIDLESVSALYAEYFLEMKQCISKSKNFCLSGEWIKLERVIHNIKGISNSLNINDIYDISNKLDNELINHIYDNANALLDQINEMFNTCERDIRKFFKDNNISI